MNANLREVCLSRYVLRIGHQYLENIPDTNLSLTQTTPYLESAQFFPTIHQARRCFITLILYHNDSVEVGIEDLCDWRIHGVVVDGGEEIIRCTETEKW